MKKRKSFVSNSSSASFVIDISRLTPLQKYAIENHIEVAAGMYKYQDAKDGYPGKVGDWVCGKSDEWKIGAYKGNQTMWHLSTSMDNFDMKHFLYLIGATPVVMEDVW